MGNQYTLPMTQKNGVIWLAGEASGDYIASLVMPEVMRRLDGVVAYGMGGMRMGQEDFHAWYDISELSVRGYMEVLMHLPRLVRLRSEMVERFIQSDPLVFVGVDAPDFNLSIEAKMRRKGIPAIHLVSPSIWAWRPERIHKIRQSVDHMLLVFPFEKEIYERAGIPATYIGHPLANIIPMTPDVKGARADFGLDQSPLPVITLMPGSRVDEIKGCGKIFFEAVERLLHRYGDCHVLIPAANDRARESIIFEASQYARLASRMIIRVGTSHRMLEACDAVLCASGTAALEAALFKKPTVVGYKMPAITGMIMQRKALISHVSLPNILLGQNVVPEFLQYFCEPDPISYALQDALENETRRQELVNRFSHLHASLQADSAHLAANVIEDFAKRRQKFTGR